jgi:hypothetical protein
MAQKRAGLREAYTHEKKMFVKEGCFLEGA